MEAEFNLLAVAGTTLICLGSVYLYKVWSSYRFFEKRGIKTVDYEFFYGNFRELRGTQNYSNVLKKWTEKYGKTYGMFEGHLPILISSDVEFLEEVFIKQSTCFSARKKESLAMSDNNKNHNLFGACKTKWKTMRTIMNPTFSSLKLRKLNPLILKCTDRLLDILGKAESKEINVSNFYKRFTMDTIWNCAFGFDIDAQHKLENPYFDKCESVFEEGVKLRFLNYIGIYLHEIKELILESLIFVYTNLLRFLNENEVIPYLWISLKIKDLLGKVIDDENSTNKNYIHLLLEANRNVPDQKTADSSVDYTKSHLNKFLTMDEVVSNLTLFMLAGYETTSSALTYASYILATHPSEQKILIEEIGAFFDNEKNIEPNSDIINDLEYLDMFVKETLRLHPIGNPVVGRRCTIPTKIKGIDIPLDLTISADVLSIHMNPELWGPVDPQEFYPPRFSPEIKRHPLAFMSFGQGPRNCIGMKFALIEMKIALIKILQKYEITKGPNTPESFNYIEGFVRLPDRPINVILKERLTKE